MQNFESPYFEIRDLIAGVLLFIAGLSVVSYSYFFYHIGTFALMGPGFFPLILGWIITFLGAFLAVLSFRRTKDISVIPPVLFRSILAVAFSILLFALLIDRAGLLVTAFLVTLSASLGNINFRLSRAILLALSLTFISWLIFVIALKVAIPIFPG